MLRNLLRAQFIKSGTLHWKSHLEDLMRSKNSNRDLVTGQSPYDALALVAGSSSRVSIANFQISS